MKTKIKKVIGVLLIIMLAFAISYLMLAFFECSFNISNWDPFSRFVCLGLFIFLAVLGHGFMFIN